jgi:hypothetical protein
MTAGARAFILTPDSWLVTRHLSLLFESAIFNQGSLVTRHYPWGKKRGPKERARTTPFCIVYREKQGVRLIILSRLPRDYHAAKKAGVSSKFGMNSV